jgi:hypothetical protein
MAYARSFFALRGLSGLFLLGVLTIVHAHSPAPRYFHANRAIQPVSVPAWTGTSAYKQIGKSGVAGMQLSVIDNRYVILFDKAEHNPLKTNDGNNAWSALLDTRTHTVKALKLKTNSFCAGELYLRSIRDAVPHYAQFPGFEGGGWLSNGTLVNYGGSAQESVPSGNGYQAIRLYTPKPNGAGTVWEDPGRVHLTTNR